MLFDEESDVHVKHKQCLGVFRREKSRDAGFITRLVMTISKTQIARALKRDAMLMLLKSFASIVEFIYF